jgi:two-component system response regulator RpaA
MAKQPMVLLIEDSPTQAQEIAGQLSQYGIDVLIAEDGPQGLHLAASRNPDLLVLDVNLPSMSGFQVCRRLRRDEQTADLPVIMLTSSGGADDMLEGLDAGATDYIPKDEFAIENLLATLQLMGLID